MRRIGKLLYRTGTMLFFFFIILASSETLNVRADSTIQSEFAEAQKIVGQFLRNETGTKWLSDLAKTKSVPITTMDLMSAIIRSVPEGGRVWEAADKLSKALKEHKFPEGSSYDSLALQRDNWKDLIANIELEDDIVCLYRKSSNETSKRSDDWKKFLKAITPGYSVHLALDTGRKYVICLKKIQLPETTLPPTSTVSILARSETTTKPAPGNPRKSLGNVEVAKQNVSGERCKDEKENDDDDDDDEALDDSISWDSDSKRRNQRCQDNCVHPIIIVVPSRNNVLPVPDQPPSASPYLNYIPTESYQQPRTRYSSLYKGLNRPGLRYSLPNYEKIDFFERESHKFPTARNDILERTLSAMNGRYLDTPFTRNGEYQVRQKFPTIPYSPGVFRKQEFPNILSKAAGRISASAIFQEMARRADNGKNAQTKSQEIVNRRQEPLFLPGRSFPRPFLFQLPTNVLPNVRSNLMSWRCRYRTPKFCPVRNNLRTRYYPINTKIRSTTFPQDRIVFKDYLSMLRPFRPRRPYERPYVRPNGVLLKPFYHGMHNNPDKNAELLLIASSPPPAPLPSLLPSLLPSVSPLPSDSPPPSDSPLSSIPPVVIENGEQLTSRRIVGRFFPLFPRQRFIPVMSNYGVQPNFVQPNFVQPKFIQPNFVRPTFFPLSTDYCRSLWNRLRPVCRLAAPIVTKSLFGGTGCSNCDSPITLKILVNRRLSEPVKILTDTEDGNWNFGSGRRAIQDGQFLSRENLNDIADEEWSHERSDFESEDENSEELALMNFSIAGRRMSQAENSTTQTSTLPEVNNRISGSEHLPNSTESVTISAASTQL